MRSLGKTALTSVHVLGLAAGLCIPTILLVQSLLAGGRLDLGSWGTIVEEWDRWTTLLGNSLKVSLSAMLLSLIGGLCWGFIAFKTRWRGRSLMVFGTLLLVCTPSFVLASAILSFTGFETSFGSVWIAGLIEGLMYTPLCSLLVGLGLLSVDRELEEAALLERRALSVAWRITCPQAAWTMLATAFITFVLSFTDYSITDVLNVETFAREIFVQFNLAGDRTRPFVTSVPVMLLLALLFVILKRCLTHSANPFHPSPNRRPLLFSLPAYGQLLAGCLAGVICLITVWAYLRLMAPLESWNHFWNTYRSFSGDWPRTIVVSCTTALILALLAPTYAWWLIRDRTWRLPTAAMVLGLLAIPAPAIGMTLVWLTSRSTPSGLMAFLGTIGVNQDPLDLFYFSSAKYVVACSLRFLPLAVLLMLPAVYRVKEVLIEAARIDAADRWTIITRIYWPEAAGNVLLAGLVVMIMAAGELDCSYLVQPPEKCTLSVRFYTFIHYGLDHQVATLCLASTLTTLIPALLIYLIAGKRLLGAT